MYDCPHHNAVGQRKGRNLIVNLDGTSNQFRNNRTNIVELFSRIIQVGGDVKQLVFYNSGIGTSARPSFRSFNYWKQVIYDYVGSVIAWDFEAIIHAAYGWLSENYEPGDRIFLFGFSRGAYQVRVIAGMIEKVGLPEKGNENQIPFAYELYTVLTAQTRASTSTEASESTSHDNQSQPQTSESEEEKLCRSFKRSLCHKDVKVHFVGVWDSVSSIGVFHGRSFPETVSGMGHVCYFRHALALDERRVNFQPEYVNGGLGPIGGSNQGNVKEVWFKGTHSDIGGDNVKNGNSKNFTDSLRWMTYEARCWGLYIEPYKGNWIPVIPKESLTWFWLPLEYLPFGSLSYETQDHLTWRPHRGRPRIIQPGQLIHQSVFSDVGMESEPSKSKNEPDIGLSIPGAFPDAMDQTDEPADTVPSEAPPPKSEVYRPKAIFHSIFEYDWEQMFSAFAASGNLPIIEHDPFENASHILTSLSYACDILATEQGDKECALNAISADTQILQAFLERNTRCASLLEVPNADETLLKVMSAAVRLKLFATAPEVKLTVIRLVANARPDQHPFPISTHLRPKFADVYKWGSSFLATTYQDDFLRALQPFAFMGSLQIGLSILNVAFSTLDPRQSFFTASSDAKTLVLTWDGSTQPPRKTADAPGPYSTISRDGSHIAVTDVTDVSIVDTTTQLPSVIKCPDAENPNESGDICSLCYSDDHQTLATGHWKGWVKLWGREGDQWKVFKSLKARCNPIESLAFSRDASNLAFTVDLGPTKVWSFDDRDPALIELKDSHENSISLVWSFSGEWIVAGTVHGRVKIWNSNLGTIEDTFEGHECTIRCLAIRDDDQVLATGSMDNTIRMWKWRTWEKIWQIDTGEWVASIAFSPGGKQLLSGGYKGTLCLWDVDIGDDET